jgi:hypothetical protein
MATERKSGVLLPSGDVVCLCSSTFTFTADGASFWSQLKKGGGGVSKVALVYFVALFRSIDLLNISGVVLVNVTYDN